VEHGIGDCICQAAVEGRSWAGDLIRRPRQTLIAAGAEGAQDQHAGFGAVPPLARLRPA
jgi:hypothetical protein